MRLMLMLGAMQHSSSTPKAADYNVWELYMGSAMTMMTAIIPICYTSQLTLSLMLYP